MNKLILIPITILVTLSIFSMLGLGNTELGSTTLSGADVVYYDSGGHEVCDGLGQPSGEDGSIGSSTTGYATWDNGTLLTTFSLYYDTSGSLDMRVKYEDFGKGYYGFKEFDITTAIGFIGLIIGIMALAALVGLKILGSGISDVSVSTIILSTAYLAIWGVFSVLAFDLIVNQIPIIGSTFYFILTIIYTAGIIASINGGTE